MANTSIVVPVFNEVENVPRLAHALQKVFKKIDKGSVEVILVDDGSNDGSWQAIKQVCKKNKHFHGLKLTRNFGQTAAMQAGIDAAKGKIIVTMDADLQNDPEDIPSLLSEMKKGYDVVSGWRFARQDNAEKGIASKFANWLNRLLTGVPIHDSGCSLKAYDAKMLKSVRLYGEMHRYIPAILSTKGARISEVKVQHHPRTAGKTKYGLGRLLRGLLDLLFIKFWSDYSTRPLHLFGTLGSAMFLLGALISFIKFIDFAVFGEPLVVGPALLAGVLLIILGVQFVILGFLGEIQVRSYYAATGEKAYMLTERA
ncbi:MAG TPA: glycosyltransferase family 2 protein [Candidatus Norongarragalinales archaeon]|nr:glycosyltransferase family 2 protein [Candidatus Norongarragalinales archaeon]